jgi:hypothetical protein
MHGVQVNRSVRTAARAAIGPIGGLLATYAFFVLTPWGRTFDSLSFHGRTGTGWSVLSADLMLLETISTVTLILALAAVVAVAALRGRRQLGVRAVAAVLGGVLSSEVLKFALPNIDHHTGQWHWLSLGSFPSGHAVIVTSISLAVLSICSDRWRRRLIGPLVAWSAIAATATVTVGWHRPGDVVGSLFLATAWHRVMSAGQPDERKLRSMLPARPLVARAGAVQGTAVLWWAGACALVLGAAVRGALRTEMYGQLYGSAALAYLLALTVLLAGVGLTVVATAEPEPARR